jgi:hypothetical protein
MHQAENPRYEDVQIYLGLDGIKKEPRVSAKVETTTLPYQENGVEEVKKDELRLHDGRGCLPMWHAGHGDLLVGR